MVYNYDDTCQLVCDALCGRQSVECAESCKKSAIAFPRSVAMGLIGGKGFVGHLGPISLFRGVPPDHKTLQQLHLASSCSAKQPLSRICLISPTEVMCVLVICT